MKSRYVFATAGNQTICDSPDYPGGPRLLPSAISVAYIPQHAWPLWHAAFGRTDLAGLWWYAPAADAVDVLTDAIDYVRRERERLPILLPAGTLRAVDAHAALMERIRADLTCYPDSVIAVGREDYE